jgi:uncharacterized membrane protein YGL010W
MNGVRDFIVDYCQRHAHPINAVLHIIGVPSVFIGIYDLFARQPGMGATLIVFGYLMQYLGHEAQGNEVGEVTLIKHMWHKFHANREA